MAGISSGNIWIDTFHSLQKKDLEERYGKRWILQFNYELEDNLTKEQKQKGWKISQTTKFAWFKCSECSHFWNSSRVTLTFHYCLRETKTGIVLLRPFGQMCRQCDHDDFESPNFKEENVRVILENLILKIRKNCYYEKIDRDIQDRKHYARRTKPHEKDLCEACIQGVCNKDYDIF